MCKLFKAVKIAIAFALLVCASSTLDYFIAPHEAYAAVGPYYRGFEYGVIGVLKSANMNSTADQAIPIATGNASQTYIVDRVLVVNASASLTLAAGGVYTAASKGGTAIVSALQVYTGLTSATKTMYMTMAVSDKRTEDPLYLSLSVAQGSAATADIYVLGFPVP